MAMWGIHRHLGHLFALAHRVVSDGTHVHVQFYVSGIKKTGITGEPFVSKGFQEPRRPAPWAPLATRPTLQRRPHAHAVVSYVARLGLRVRPGFLFLAAPPREYSRGVHALPRRPTAHAPAGRAHRAATKFRWKRRANNLYADNYGENEDVYCGRWVN